MILEIKMKDNEYQVIIERGLLEKAINYLDIKPSRKALILTDSGIPTKYVETLTKQIKNEYVYVIKAGEESKSFDKKHCSRITRAPIVIRL